VSISPETAFEWAKFGQSQLDRVQIMVYRRVPDILAFKTALTSGYVGVQFCRSGSTTERALTIAAIVSVAVRMWQCRYQFDYETKAASKTTADPNVLAALGGPTATALTSSQPSPLVLATFLPWRQSSGPKHQLRVVKKILKRLPRSGEILFRGRFPLANAVRSACSSELVVRVLRAFPAATLTCAVDNLVPLLRQRRTVKRGSAAPIDSVPAQAILASEWTLSQLNAARTKLRELQQHGGHGGHEGHTSAFIAPCILATEVKQLFRLILEEPLTKAVQNALRQAARRQQALRDRLAVAEHKASGTKWDAKVHPAVNDGDTKRQLPRLSSTQRIHDDKGAYVSPDVIEAVVEVVTKFLGEEVALAAPLKSEV